MIAGNYVVYVVVLLRPIRDTRHTCDTIHVSALTLIVFLMNDDRVSSSVMDSLKRSFICSTSCRNRCRESFGKLELSREILEIDGCAN